MSTGFLQSIATPACPRDNEWPTVIYDICCSGVTYREAVMETLTSQPIPDEQVDRLESLADDLPVESKELLHALVA